MPESFVRRALRRCLTVPLYVAATLVLTALSPVLLPVAAMASLSRRARGAVRTLGFVLAYLWCETAGITIAFWLWLRHRMPRPRQIRWGAFLHDNYRLQCAWSNALKRSAEVLFDLEFQVEGATALEGRGAIVLARHASMADTIIPMVFYAIPEHIRLRYVLKRELLIDPCLDIVGNRLPNCFVDRDADDAGPEVERVRRLAVDLAEDEGVLIYPEGTRFSAERRGRALQRLQGRATEDDLARMQRWTHLLPPRLGGTLALLEANPGRDLVFCAHRGFEGSTHFSNLLNGSWIGSSVRLAFWRIPFAEVPTDTDGRRAFVFAQWDRMQDTVDRLLNRA